MRDKMTWHEALDNLKTRTYWAWSGDEPGVFLARAANGSGVIQLNDRTTMFGQWDGERGTDGALLTTDNGNVYNECGGLVSRGSGQQDKDPALDFDGPLMGKRVK